MMRKVAVCAALAACLAGAAKPRGPLFKISVSASPAAPDTLEVYVVYVNFQNETDGGASDEPTTTGHGVFGSDKDLKYTLDPNGNLRSYRDYLDKHFEFARNYFERVSGGRVIVRHQTFPPPVDGKVTPVQVSRRMKHYNPSELDKSSKQKTRDFNEERAMRLMSFVAEAIHKADAPEAAAANPFLKAKADSAANPGAKTHRAFMLFHAGHSRLLDGGQLGPFGADSPNDFTDFFVTRPDFSFLDSATVDGTRKGKLDPAKQADSLGVKVRSNDTISEIMMVSESASQDKLNWGINGILVNQLARKMGMPDMFDIVKGISQLGYFDMMDFAGANSENGRGFLPVLPSAWVRYFMGWETPVVARPGGGPFSEYKLAPPGTSAPGAATTLKVPINEREYLLVENRQRARGDSVTVYFSRQENAQSVDFSVRDSTRIPFAFADSLLEDSVCVEYNANKSCKKKAVNERRPKGVITGASDYDLALPASGLLVWHVNEWFIEQFLRFGAVNAYLGDTLRSQYKGVELVEADGSPSIGKEFRDPLGQPAFDYGSGSDMFPHIRRRQKDPPKDTTWLAPDTINVIGPYTQANTNAWNDGRTHLTLEAPIPASARLERGISTFSRDSIFALRDSLIALRVHWPDHAVMRGSDWEWPARVAPGTNPQSVAVLRHPKAGERYVVALSDSGHAQAFTAGGRPALEPVDSLPPRVGYDSVKTLLPSGRTRDDGPVYVTSLAGRLGRPVGQAVLQDTLLAVLASDRLTLLRLDSARLASRSRDSAAAAATLPLAGAAGPLAVGDRVWVVTADDKALSFDGAGRRLDSIPLPDFSYQSLATLPAGGGFDLVAVGAGGQAARVNTAAGSAAALDIPWGDRKPRAGEFFTAAVSDFDRDGSADLFLLGAEGSALLVSLKAAPAAFAGFPQAFPRRVDFLDTTHRYEGGKLVVDTTRFFSEDRTGPALGDLDADGRPDILFGGTNSVFAIDYRGATLPGWPFRPETRQNVGFLYGNRRHPETQVSSTPLVLSLDGKPAVLVGSPDGLIYAVDAQGKKLRTSSFDPKEKTRMGILASDRSDWPLTMGGMTLDTAANPFVQLSLADLDDSAGLELIAQSGTGGLSAWMLREAKAEPLKGLAWTEAGGDPGRRSFLDVSAWAAPASAGGRESIDEFFLFPSPLRGPLAGVHLRLGAAAAKARIRVYDIAGNVVADQGWSNLAEGKQPASVLDLRRLGADVYTALVEVSFPGGKKKKWARIGVIR